jgi:hypothetical protein
LGGRIEIRTLKAVSVRHFSFPDQPNQPRTHAIQVSEAASAEQVAKPRDG